MTDPIETKRLREPGVCTGSLREITLQGFVAAEVLKLADDYAKDEKAQARWQGTQLHCARLTRRHYPTTQATAGSPLRYRLRSQLRTLR